ncbi:hypothetical protein Zm00014a_002682 [Zea mays]|jgi:hypothetical protein|uniref:Avr9/Cf-9 rapidly elicited protein 194 n=2 Tax=Zea mays TaxID=4577 RepID=B6T2I5_MAIZE|nr:avr9/Cf-9 rapidly elicited protein 194 [Zea mays]ACG31318.1 avr9/Cf-9 rapidly elicited protein 194 [Zea mays]AQL03710.1 Avr9/Cf-9 rapidly elicited protein 194 [Zea mays]PWZ06665.1 hypothetical protein Zm00014a_002682 [Zea mays]|eukprot:NP_001148396.1 avr9/Cf-9 rapidly elicited protein 194 [Zea mays]
MATADHEATDDSSGGPLLVWDCGSMLYDSYELTAFKRQLDAAVLSSSRSLSMPHLTASVATTSLPTTDVQQQQGRRRRRRRLPALLRRLFSRVLRLRLFPATGARGAHYWTGDDRTGSPWSGALTSIPEEQSSSSPEMAESPVVEPAQSKLRKTQSERFIGSKAAAPMVQFDVVL